MARLNLDNWVPLEQSSEVFSAVAQTSAVEALATRESMSSNAKEFHRDVPVDIDFVPKGGVYGEDTSEGDKITLTARKFGKIFRMAEEDLADSPVNHIARKQTQFLKTYNVWIDNATLATTGADNGDTVPFTSVYRALATADETTGYTAGANIIKTSGAVTYDALSDLLALAEESDRFGEVVIIAHPSFKAALRGVKDDNGSPLFVQGLAGTPDTVFGYPVHWSRGAKTSEVATETPTGNPLMIVVSKDAMRLGVRSGPEFQMAAPNSAGFNTDETLLKGRARRAFMLAHPNAAAILEVTSA